MHFYTDYRLPAVVREPETFRTPRNLFLKCLILFAVFMMVQTVESIGMVIGIMPRLMEWARTQINWRGELDSEALTLKIQNMLTDPVNMHIMLLCTGLGSLIVLLFCRVVQGRKLSTIGFFKEKAGWQYLAGLGTGFVMFSSVILLMFLTGGLKFEGRETFSSMLAVIFLGYVIQGMSEEILCRGYFMTDVLRHHNVWWAVGLNSLAFGLMHASNPGFGVMALVNLVLYAVMISLYTLRTNSLWGSCAIHSIWNFAQGNFYGMPVSGMDSGESVFRTSLQGSAIVNGGDFGPEASIATTIVMIVCIAVLLFVPMPFLDNHPQPEAITDNNQKS